MQLKSIQVKVTSWTGLCLLLMVSALLIYSALSYRQTATQSAQQQALLQAQPEIAAIKDHLDQALTLTNTMAPLLANAKASGAAGTAAWSRDAVRQMMRQMLTDNPHFEAVYCDWEQNAFDGSDAQFAGKSNHNADGRFNFVWSRDEKGSPKVEAIRAGSEDKADWYQLPKKSLQSAILEPTRQLAQSKDSKAIGLVSPIISNGKFQGVIGVNIKTEAIQKLTDQTNLFDQTGQLMLLSNKGIIAALTGQPAAANSTVSNIFPELSEAPGSSVANQPVLTVAGGSLQMLMPLTPGKTNTPWAIGLVVPQSVITKQILAQLWKQLAIALSLLVVTLLIVWKLTGQALHAQAVQPEILPASEPETMTETEPVKAITETPTEPETTPSQPGTNPATEAVKDQQWQQDIVKFLEQVRRITPQNGELNVSNDPAKAIPELLHFMLGTLRRIIAQTQEVTNKVASTASETETTTEMLAREAETQAAQISAASQTIETMTVAIEKLSEQMTRSATVAQHSLNNVRQGTKAVQHTFDGLQMIRYQVRDFSQQLKYLTRNSQEIEEAVQLINGLNKRTSMLALNAAIQAAQVGDAGRGFAVIAEEIERMTRRSVEATNRINQLVKSMQNGSQDTISAIEANTREVMEGAQIADQTGQALEEIEAVSDRLSELIIAISRASQEQRLNSTSVATALTEISELTQRTAAEMKQSNGTAHQLAELADELRSFVASFHLPSES